MDNVFVNNNIGKMKPQILVPMVTSDLCSIDTTNSGRKRISGLKCHSEEEVLYEYSGLGYCKCQWFHVDQSLCVTILLIYVNS